MKIRLKENLSTNIIILFYILTIMILILDKSNSLPIANVLRKFKYVHLLFAIFYCLKCSKGCFHKKGLIFVGLFMLHTVLFGKVFVNYDLLVLTNEHFREMMIHIALVFFTYYFVWCEIRSLKKFANVKHTDIFGDIRGWERIIKEFSISNSEVYRKNLFNRRKEIIPAMIMNKLKKIIERH